MRTREERAHLTKSRYLSGLRCQKQLWLEVYSPKHRTPPDEGQRAIMEQGIQVGQEAWKLFPRGVLIDEPPWAHEMAVSNTLECMKDPDPPAIFEAAFEWQGIRVRVDLLERLGEGAWGLREVKSSAGLKDRHLDDVAIQLFVLEGSGLRVPSVELVLVEQEYTLGDEGIDWAGFFRREDVTAQCRERLSNLPDHLEMMRAVLRDTSVPRVEPGSHCHVPYPCPFWDHCTNGKPEDWIYYLPKLGDRRMRELREQGIEEISRIPDDFPLKRAQRRARQAFCSGEAYVSPGLSKALSPCEPPAVYLDFEAMNPVVPLYPGTRPYQIIPFQWSLHRRGIDDTVTHEGFIDSAREDPRRAFASTLIRALGGSTEPVVVYSSFEALCLGRLADAFPDLGEQIRSIRSRVFDLLPVVREHVYHPAFHRSFSIKDIGPVLAPRLTYDDLEGIASGSVASSAMAKVARGDASAEEAERILDALVVYCTRDTLALLEVHRALEKLCRHQEAATT
jgi:hypothetical protein